MHASEYQFLVGDNCHVLKNFTALTVTQKLQLLNWRNAESTRKFMNTTDIISEKNHLSYIDNLKTDATKTYFKIEDIGVVYITDLDYKLPQIGLYVNPGNPKVGKGTLLMYGIIFFSFNILELKEIGLEVLDNNVRAKKLYLKFGFFETGKFGNRVHMKLQNDR